MLVFKVHNPARISDTDSCRGRFTLANKARSGNIGGEMKPAVLIRATALALAVSQFVLRAYRQ